MSNVKERNKLLIGCGPLLLFFLPKSCFLVEKCKIYCYFRQHVSLVCVTCIRNMKWKEIFFLMLTICEQSSSGMLSRKSTILRKSREHLNCLETKREFSRVNIFFSLVIQHVSNNNTMYYYRQCKTNVSVKLIKEKVVIFFFFFVLFP